MQLIFPNELELYRLFKPGTELGWTSSVIRKGDTHLVTRTQALTYQNCSELCMGVVLEGREFFFLIREFSEEFREPCERWCREWIMSASRFSQPERRANAGTEAVRLEREIAERLSAAGRKPVLISEKPTRSLRLMRARPHLSILQGGKT